MVLFWRRVAADKLFALRCVSVRYRVGSFCGTPTPSKNTAENGHSRSLAYRRQLLRVTIYYEVLNGVCTNTPSVGQRPVERAQWRCHNCRTEERIVSGDSPRLRALPGGQVAIGTYPVGLWAKSVAQMILLIFRNCEFPKTGKLALYIGIFLFFEQILYKVSSSQWTNRKNCCIIISFLCRGLNAVIYRKR